MITLIRQDYGSKSIEGEDAREAAIALGVSGLPSEVTCFCRRAYMYEMTETQVEDEEGKDNDARWSDSFAVLLTTEAKLKRFLATVDGINKMKKRFNKKGVRGGLWPLAVRWAEMKLDSIKDERFIPKEVDYSIVVEAQISTHDLTRAVRQGEE